MLSKPIHPTEIILHPDGSVYHLAVTGENFADYIILTGDPGRAAMVASCFSRIVFRKQHREFVTITGEYGGRRVTVIGTGIGVDNTEIVLNELHIAANFHPGERVFTGERTFSIVRMGTSGTLCDDVVPGSSVLTEYAIGIDGLFHFYDDPLKVSDEEAKAAFIRQTHWPGTLPTPYIVGCSFALANRIGPTDYSGFTITAPGFYAPQGRNGALMAAFPDLYSHITGFSFRQKRVINVEMETSALYALGRSLGHRTVSVCLVLANRATGKFLSDYQPLMLKLCRQILDAAGN